MKNKGMLFCCFLGSFLIGFLVFRIAFKTMPGQAMLEADTGKKITWLKAKVGPHKVFRFTDSEKGVTCYIIQGAESLAANSNKMRVNCFKDQP